MSGAESELVLGNPISSEMSVMRSSVWPGLLAVAEGGGDVESIRVRDAAFFFGREEATGRVSIYVWSFSIF